MKTLLKFSFTLMQCRVSQNKFVIAKNPEHDICVMSSKTEFLSNELIYIDKTIYDAFFESDKNSIKLSYYENVPVQLTANNNNN